MVAPRFKAGDRVRARTAVQIPIGTHGTVQELAYTMPNTYLVLFDGWTDVRLLREHDLELIHDAPSSEREPTA